MSPNAAKARKIGEGNDDPTISFRISIMVLIVYGPRVEARGLADPTSQSLSELFRVSKGPLSL